MPSWARAEALRKCVLAALPSTKCIQDESADISCFKRNHAAVVRRKQGDLCLENSRRSSLCRFSLPKLPEDSLASPSNSADFQFPHLRRIPIQSLQLTPNSQFPALSAESQCSTASNTRRAALVVDNTSMWPCRPLRRWIRRRA